MIFSGFYRNAHRSVGPGSSTWRLKKLLAALIVVGGLSSFAATGTFALLTSEQTNRGATAASGTLTFNDVVNTGTACFSYGGPASPGNVNTTCQALMTSATLNYPGVPITPVKVTITNDGSIDAGGLSVYMPSCTAGATPGAPANNSATVVTTVTASSVCTSAGTVYGTQDYTQYAGRTSHAVHVQVTADCEWDRTTGRLVLKSGSVLVTVDGQVLINAGTSALTLVSITTSRDAIVKGSYAGTPFTVTLHDGECSTQGGDSIRVQYGSLDTSTLSPKRADVRIDKN